MTQSGTGLSNDRRHGNKAKNGWYRYDTRFGIPVYSELGEIERYNIFRARMLVRCDENNKLFLYDVGANNSYEISDMEVDRIKMEHIDELLYCKKYGSYEVESVMGLSPSAIIEKDFEYIDDKLVEALLMVKVLAEKIAGKAILELI